MKNAMHHHLRIHRQLRRGPIARTAFTAFACLVLGTGLARAEPESGTVTVADGDVKSVPEGGGEGTEVKGGDKVAVGTTIVTGAASRAVIVITPRSAIRVGENSEVLIAEVDEESTPQKVLVDVKDGGLAALLKPNAAGEMDFRIKTPTGIAAARGTFYAVVVEDGKGYAQVKEGRVEITPEP